MIPRIRSFIAASLYFAVAVPAGAAPSIPSITAKPISEAVVLDGVNETWDAPGLGRRTERDRQAILKLTWLFAA